MVGRVRPKEETGAVDGRGASAATGRGRAMRASAGVAASSVPCADPAEHDLSIRRGRVKK